MGARRPSTNWSRHLHALYAPDKWKYEGKRKHRRSGKGGRGGGGHIGKERVHESVWFSKIQVADLQGVGCLHPVAGQQVMVDHLLELQHPVLVWLPCEDSPRQAVPCAQHASRENIDRQTAARHARSGRQPGKFWQ